MPPAPPLSQRLFVCPAPVGAALLACALAASSSAVAHARSIYYVAPPPSGSDANPGSLVSPWATLQHAADTLVAGDTVLVRAGSYAGVQLTTSGTSALPIVLAAYPGEEPEIVSDNASTPDGINLEGASWVTVEGFRVDGRTRAGIRAVLCEHVTVRDNRLDANGRWGIFTGFCDDLLIEGNVATNSVDEHGIYVSNSGDRPTIRDNLIHGNDSNGIHMNGDVSQGGDGVISEALVERNVLFDNGVGGGSGINCDGVQNSVIRNNLVYATHASGISLYRIDGGGPSTGNRVLHNTVLVASGGRWGLNVRDGSTGNTVRNNVFFSSDSYRGAMSVAEDSLPGFDSDYNAVEDRFTTDDGDSVIALAQWQAETGQDAHSVAITPAGAFVDVGGDDFHPLENGPLVDAGVALSDVLEDLDGNARPMGLAPDLGAYELLDAGIFWETFETDSLDRWSRRRSAP